MGGAGVVRRMLAAGAMAGLVALLAPWLAATAVSAAPAVARGPAPAGGAAADRAVEAIRSQFPRTAGAVAAPGPVVGPERGVSDPVESPAPGAHEAPAVAFDGTNYLVVWSDNRREEAWGDVYGARVTPSGTVLDRSGIAIATGPSSQSVPRVAFGGGTYLVVWTEQSPTATGTDIVGARVDPAGALLDPSGVPVSTSTGNQYDPVVAYGGGTFLVAWQDGTGFPGPPSVRGARLSPAGAVLDPVAIVISAGHGNLYQPTLAYGGGVFLAVWIDVRVEGAPAVYGARVDPAGAVLDPDGFAISTASPFPFEPAVASNGTDFLAVWGSGGYPQRLVGARVATSGAVLDPAGIAVAPAATGDATRPAVVAMGSTFLVAWYDSSGLPPISLVGARVDAGGTSLDPAGFVISDAVFDYHSSSARPGLSAGGGGAFAAWPDDRHGDASRHVYATAVGPDGSPAGPGRLVDRSADEQRASAVAFDGTNHLVVWSGSRSGSVFAIYGARVSPSGRVLDPTAIRIAPDAHVPAGVDVSLVAVDFDGANFLVVWQGAAGGMFAVRVSPAGEVLDQPIRLPTERAPYHLSVAFNGSVHLVTWQEFDLRTTRVRAARVSPDGEVLDPAGFLIGDGGDRSAVASDGVNFLVTWRFEQRILGTRVGPDGSLLDPSGFVISGTSNWIDRPAVAWNGHRYLAVWQTREIDSEPWRIVAARVTADGAVVDPAGIAVGAGSPLRSPSPAVAANGLFLVAWREQRPAGDRLLGARIGDDGVVRDPGGFVIASGTDQREAAVSRGPGATWAVTSSRFVADPPYGANRVVLRTVAPK
jgi:hypothetical protein